MGMRYRHLVWLAALASSAPPAAEEIVTIRRMSLETARDIAQGAVGVSGAPGGDKDEACARDGLARVQARLEFAD